MASRFTLFFSIFLLLGFLGQNSIFGQFGAVTMDGTVSSLEYTGNVLNLGAIGDDWYVTWDATNLWIAKTGGGSTQPILIYLDLDPKIPVNDADPALASYPNGSLEGTTDFSMKPDLPFSADVRIYWTGSFAEVKVRDGANGWTDPALGVVISTTSIFPGIAGPTGVIEVATGNGGLTRELRLGLSGVAIGSSSLPQKINFLGYQFDPSSPCNGSGSGNFIYHQAPTQNGGGCVTDHGNSPDMHFYYSIENTTDPTTATPFAQVSFTQFNGGEFVMNSSVATTLFDVTVNDNAADNADNTAFSLVTPNRLVLNDNLTVGNDLFIGASSLLIPQVARTPVLTMTGRRDTLFNEGRIDCNPDDANFSIRKLGFIFSGVTVLTPTVVDKGFFRLSDITIDVGDSLRSAETGVTELELQWGEMNNNGVLDLQRNPGVGEANVGIRGNLSALTTTSNTYELSGAGEFEFNDLLIGRDASTLQPSTGSGVLDIHVKGDFENYSSLVARNGADMLDFYFSGTQKQAIKGNVDETVGALTTFHNLIIDNDNENNDNNVDADVHFESFQNVSPAGSLINYEVTGQLTLTTGDLVTRNRTTNEVHKVTLKSGATVDATGATSDMGTNPSSFVDGPLSAEIDAIGLTTVTFPVGKTTGGRADYRPLTAEFDYGAATAESFTAEMFNANRAGAFGFPATISGDVIGNISNVRYWDLSPDAGSNFTGVKVTLAYGKDEQDDGADDAVNLRMIKENGTDWENVTPNLGGTANGTGTITSQTVTKLSNFTLANLVAANNGLPVELSLFTGRVEEAHAQLFWKTQQEVISAYFEVERSWDGRLFQPVGRVAAAGNSQETLVYDLEDPLQLTGSEIRYYRLRIHSLDGTDEYSNLVELSLNDVNKLELVVIDDIQKTVYQVTGVDAQLPYQLRLTDISGRLIWRDQIFPQAISDQGNLPPLSAGVYYLEASQEGVSVGKKFFKSR